MTEVMFQGKTYKVIEDATFSNCVFPGWWGDAEVGETYTAQFWANAEGPDGEDYRVTWEFPVVKGEEPEDAGEYPFTDSNIVSVTLL